MSANFIYDALMVDVSGSELFGVLRINLKTNNYGISATLSFFCHAELTNKIGLNSFFPNQ